MKPKHKHSELFMTSTVNNNVNLTMHKLNVKMFDSDNISHSTPKLI
jgi:hypothetical protein